MKANKAKIERKTLCGTAGPIYGFFWRNGLPLTRYPFLIRENDTLLDLGCGWGRFLLTLGPNRCYAVGLDINNENLKYLRRNLAETGINIDVVCADAEYLPFRPRSFTKVFCNSVIQHLDYTKTVKIVQNMALLTKGGGLFCLQFPNKLSIRGFIHLFLGLKRKEQKASRSWIRYWDFRSIHYLVRKYFGIVRFEAFGFLLFENNEEHIRDFPLPVGLLIASLSSLKKISNRTGLWRIADSLLIFAEKRRKKTTTSIRAKLRSSTTY